MSHYSSLCERQKPDIFTGGEAINENINRYYYHNVKAKN